MRNVQTALRLYSLRSPTFTSFKVTIYNIERSRTLYTIPSFTAYFKPCSTSIVVWVFISEVHSSTNTRRTDLFKLFTICAQCVPATNNFLCLLVLHTTPDSLGLNDWGTWHRCQRWDLIVEWRNLVTGEEFHQSQMGLERWSLQIAQPLL